MNDVDDEGRPLSVRRFAVRRVGAPQSPGSDTDVVAIEEPLGIRLGYSRADGSRAEEEVSKSLRNGNAAEDASD